MNALRYVAGYTIRAVKEKENAMEEVIFIFSMAGDEESGLGTEDWTDSLDRGGLWHVSDKVSRLFYAMEEEIRAVNQSRTPEKSIQKEFTEKLHSSETVMFHWSIISAEIDEDQGTGGESSITHHPHLCVNMRQKTLQKKKPLRTVAYSE